MAVFQSLEHRANPLSSWTLCQKLGNVTQVIKRANRGCHSRAVDNASASAAEPWSATGYGERSKIGIVLIHGFTGNPCALRPIGELLAKRGFTVDIPRLPGHGTRLLDIIPMRYADWFAHVDKAVHELQSRAEHIVLVGLSMGATLALDLASSGAAAVSGVATINAQILDRGGIGARLAPLIERFVPVVPLALAGLREDDVCKPNMHEHAYRWVPAAAGQSFLKELPRIRAQLCQLSCPVSVIYSRRDHCVPPANSRALMELLRHTRVNHLILERSYHLATLDHDQLLIEACIAAFADSVALLSPSGTVVIQGASACAAAG